MNWVAALLKILLEEIDNARHKMQTGAASIDTVVAVCVDLHVKLLASLYKGFGIFGSILEMYVVVGQTVADKQVSVQLVGKCYGIVAVTVRIFGRSVHITLRIDGVVETEIGYGGDSYTGLENTFVLAHAHKGIVAAKAPAPDANPVFVDKRLACHVFGRFNLVVSFKMADAEMGAFLESCSTATGSTTVNADNNETLAAKITFEQTAS